MSVKREVLAEMLNLKPEDVKCEKCSASSGEGVICDCEFWTHIKQVAFENRR